MPGIFVDANVFLRHLLDDDPVKSPACKEFFSSIEKRRLDAWTTSLVIAEIVFVLSNRKTYNVNRQELSEVLLPLIMLPNLALERKSLYHRTFDLYASTGIDYIDAYHAALVERLNPPGIASYDTHFDVVPTIQRREP